MSRIFKDYWSFAALSLLFAGSFMAATAFTHSAALASLCTTSISTAWSTSTNLGDGSVGTSNTSFTGCSTSSSFAGTYEDQPHPNSEELDLFSYSVSAPSGEAIQVDISATDGARNGKKAAFPNFSLILSDLDWGDETGTLTGVELTSFDTAGFGFDNVTDTGFDITFTGFEYNCGGTNDGCGISFSALFTLTVEHDDGGGDPNPDPVDIPEPASAGLFLAGLAGMGVVMRRRRKQAA